MNNWFRIAVPILIAVLLITATVGITLAVTGKGAAGQAAAPAFAPGQDTQYARGPQCSNCAGNSQGAVSGDQDSLTGNVYVPKGATCPNCPGYASGTSGQTTTYRGGCCGSR